jgi:hypothetical protein
MCASKGVSPVYQDRRSDDVLRRDVAMVAHSNTEMRTIAVKVGAIAANHHGGVIAGWLHTRNDGTERKARRTLSFDQMRS